MGKMRTVAVVNGGGDAPGLNAVIRGVMRSAINTHGMRVVDIRNGFAGLIWPEGAKELTQQLALEVMKLVDPGNEIVNAARAIGTSLGGST